MNILAQIIDPALQTKAQLWAYAVAFITPLIIAAVKWATPKIPTWALPSMAPLVGLLVGLGTNALVGLHLSWVDCAALGTLGVGIREIVNQNVTKRINATPPGD